MAKTDDWLAGLRAPLMVWVMALVTGGAVLLPRTGGTPAGQRTPSPESKPPQPTLPREAGAAALADARQVIELLAEATGVSLDVEATPRAIHALRNLLRTPAAGGKPDGAPDRAAGPDAVDRSDAALLQALATLEPLAGAPLTSHDDSPELQTAEAQAALRALRRYAVADDARAADVRRHLARVLAFFNREPDDLANLNLIASTLGCEATTTFVVATLPDYVDSQVRRLFDLVMSGVQQAAAATGFTLDRFYLPNGPGTLTSEGPAFHEDHPGAVIFRRGAGPGKRPELLVLLVITETPTAGLHQRAFLAAAELVAAWRDARRGLGCAVRAADAAAPTPALRILGPTFSGTAQSLQLALQRIQDRRDALTPVQIVTGSATAPSNCGTLSTGYRTGFAVQYRTTNGSNDDVLEALSAYLGRIRPPWREGKGVALLLESNTVFGQSIAPPDAQAARTAAPREDVGAGIAASSGPEAVRPASRPPAASCDPPPTGSRTPLPEAIRVRFPLHVSRLRNQALATDATAAGLARPRIDLAEATPSTDLVPAASPELTSAVADAALRALFASLRREHISALGIFATDARDHLFLAREIRREMPNAQIFGTQGDLLYLNPEYAPFLFGTIIASPYALFNESQLETPLVLAPPARGQFMLSAEQGVYNALIALLGNLEPCGDGSPFTCINARAPVLDFGAPGAPCEGGLCTPPVWISVVGRREVWPLAADIRPGSRDVLRLRQGAPQPRHDAAITTWWTAMVFTLILIVTWFHALGLLLAELQRAREEAADPPPARSRSPRTLRDTVDEACVRRTYWRFEAWRALHYLPSQVSREAPRTRYGPAAPVSRTQAERCADQAHDGAMLSLLVTLGLVNAWLLRWAWLGLLDRDAGINVLLGAGVVTFLTAGILLSAIVVTAGRLVGRAARTRAGRNAAAEARCRGKAPAPRRRFRLRLTTPWLRNGVGWGLAATATLAIVLIAALATLRQAPSPGLAFTRATSLTSGVSPTPPVLLLAAVLYLTATWNLRRLKMHRYSLPNGCWIGELLSGGSGAFVRRLRRTALEFAPWQSTGSRIAVVMPITVGVVLTTAGSVHGYTVEGRLFTWWFWGASVVALVAMARIASRAAAQADVLQQALERLGTHAIGEAYRTVGARPFEWSLTLSPLRRSALMPVIDDVRLLVAASDELEGLAPAERAEVRAAAQAAAHDAAPWRDDRVPAMATHEWRRLLDLGRVLTKTLEQHYWSPEATLRRERAEAVSGGAARATTPPKPPPLTPLARAELIVAYMLAFVIRSLLARVVSSLSTALAGFTIVLVAHLTYTFAGRAFWVRVDLACLTTTAIVTCYTLLRFERNRVLSLLWSTDPGRINWTGGFIYRIAVTVALPLILLVASLFPEIGGSLVSVLEPLQKALP